MYNRLVLEMAYAVSVWVVPRPRMQATVINSTCTKWETENMEGDEEKDLGTVMHGSMSVNRQYSEVTEKVTKAVEQIKRTITDTQKEIVSLCKRLQDFSLGIMFKPGSNTQRKTTTTLEKAQMSYQTHSLSIKAEL